MGEVARFTRSEVCVSDASEVHFVSEVCAELLSTPAQVIIIYSTTLKEKIP